MTRIKICDYKPSRKLANTYVLTDKPQLIQRVEWKDPPCEYKEGVDRYFGFNYMGSSEFEWGSLPSALGYMREDVAKWDKHLPVEMRAKMRTDKCVAWYVGPPEGLDPAEKLFDWQLDEKKRYDRRGWYLKERTEIYEAYTDKVWPSRTIGWSCHVIGWWAIDAAPCPWVFFMKKEHAEQWLKCLKEKSDAKT